MTTTAVLLALFLAIFGPFMADEVKAWSRWLHKKLRSMAVAKLPKNCRDRYEEEWGSGLEEIPGEIGKIFYSVGLLWAGARIRSAALESAVNSEAPFTPLKRIFDIVFSSLVIAFLIPVLLAIAIAIKLDSPGPVFYASKRVGKKGRVFRCFKFRTLAFSGVGLNEGRFDPHITRLGRFLRRHSLDEFPQFFNVLLGDMSIVGPRPPLASDVRRNKLSHPHSLDVSPGITGLWQGEGSQDPSSVDVFLEKLYRSNWSIWLDFVIILRTVAEVLRFPRNKKAK